VVAAAVGVIVAALVAVLATRAPARVAEAASPLLGQPAPALAGTSADGQPVDLATMRGRFVLVNFFASWCGPCRTEQPELVTLSRSIPLIGVVFQDSPSAAETFLREGGARWPAVPDPDGAAALDWGVRGPPESYLVAPDGTVVAKVLGPVTASQASYLRSVMARVDAGGR
jgi:cytochrome c biogenesis protein CcmG/thiol:disulfide interchange protein DsbE